VPVEPLPLLARNLRVARTRKGLTQKEAAQVIATTSITVSNHERAVTTPNDRDIVAYAAAYDVTPQQLRYEEALAEVLERGPDLESDLKAATERLLRSHRVRIWLADFRAELTRLRASDREIANALAVAKTPTVLLFFSPPDERGVINDDHAIRGLELLATAIRASLKQRA
jgi:transcriptional regulator with XRE-family HTH domain